MAKRIVRRSLMETQRREWRKMKTKMGELMDVGEDEQLPKAVTFQHPVAKIASRVNRMRTQKTRFQQREWKKSFCKLECVEEIGFQCEKCAACGNGGRWSFRWTKCSCTDEKGQRVDRNVAHMLTECKATQGIKRAQNKLWSFHVRSAAERARLDDVIRATSEDQGDRKEAPDGEMKWQRMVIPIGRGHLGRRWHEKNNELIYEVRNEHIRAQRTQRALGGRPPPKPPPMPTPCGAMGKGEKRVKVVQEADRRSKRRRKVVHREFFVQ